MAFNAEQISYAGKIAMDYIVRKAPEDLYNTERPLLKKLKATKKTFPGAKQYINEKLRFTNDSNFQWFGPDGLVTYNRKRTVSEADYPWGSAHDGFGLTEEELLQNFITMTDDKNAHPTTSEKHQFVNLITENMETLLLGFDEKLDYDLHLDGTQDADAIVGLDGIIKIDPTAGTLGGIDQSVAAGAYFRNNVSLNIAKANLKVTMKQVWRACTRIGGHKPNFIMCGSVFLDIYEEIADATINRQMMVSGKGGVEMDIAISQTNYMGVPMVWSPVFDDLEANLSPTQQWDSRCYFINTNFLKLRPAKGQDMITRNPPRAYDRYTHYWALTWRGGLTTNKPGSMAVLTVTGS